MSVGKITLIKFLGVFQTVDTLAIMSEEKSELTQALDELKEYSRTLQDLIDEGNKPKDDWYDDNNF